MKNKENFSQVFKGMTRSTYVWLVILVTALNLFFLRDSWGLGVIGEDYLCLLQFIIKHNTGNIFLKLFQFWFNEPLYYGAIADYLGVLTMLTGGNFLVIQIINFIGKIIASVLFYTVINKFTKHKPLAIMSCLFFSIAYSAAGFLQSHGVSAAYWGIVLYFFFALNYQTLISNSKKHLKNSIIKYAVSFLLIYFALAFGLLRLFAVPGLILIAEILMVITKYSSWKDSLLRAVLFVFLPFAIFIKFHGMIDNTAHYKAGVLSNTLSQITSGNLFIFLNPLAGLSLTFAPREWFAGFTLGRYENLAEFFGNLIRSFGLLYIFLAASFAFLFPLNRKRYLIISSILSLSINLLIYFMSRHYTAGAPRFDMIPEILTGGFILALTIPLGVEWILGKKDNILIAVAFISPLFTLYYTFMNWIVNMGPDGSFTYEDGMHRYLTVPELGTSLFLASLVLIILKRKYQNSGLRIWGISVISAIILFVICADIAGVGYFPKFKSQGTNIWDMKAQQVNFTKNYIKNDDIVLYYLKTSNAPADVFMEETTKYDLIGKLAYLNNYLDHSGNQFGCIMDITDASSFKDGNFKSIAFCPVKPGEIPGQYMAIDKIVQLPLEKLFAFTFNNGQVVDLTPWVKSALLKGQDPNSELLKILSKS
jgi:hypothetical protein